jgi:hypothetical protein
MMQSIMWVLRRGNADVASIRLELVVVYIKIDILGLLYVYTIIGFIKIRFNTKALVLSRRFKSKQKRSGLITHCANKIRKKAELFYQGHFMDDFLIARSQTVEINP